VHFSASFSLGRSAQSVPNGRAHGTRFWQIVKRDWVPVVVIGDSVAKRKRSPVACSRRFYLLVGGM